jgi:hypothetical protein
MSFQNAPRLNLSFVNLDELEGTISAYNRPMPIMVRKDGEMRKLYALMSKKEWIAQSSLSSKNIEVNSDWKKRKPILVDKDTFDEKFVLLKGNESDNLAVYGLKPKELTAIQVDIPACIIKNGQRLLINSNDMLLSLGDNKLVFNNHDFEQLFSLSLEDACELKKDIKAINHSNNHEATLSR